ncbi:MBL fold metallo-hydrolase [Planctomycetota bacterium]
MKKKINLILLTAFLGFFVLASWAQRRSAVPVEFKKISERLYEIAGGSGANGGFYIGDAGVLVIDAKQNQDSVDQVIAGIKKITDKPIKYLVNTHSDGDHITGNQFFPESVTIIAHENCRKEFFVSRTPGAQSEWTKPQLAPFVPALTFRDKMDIHLGAQTVELHYFGVGHTTGDLVLYFPQEKTAFLGDQVFVGRVPLIHSYKGGNSHQQVNTLSKMLETLDAQKFCSGHSDVIDRAGVKNHINLMKQRQTKVKTLIDAGKNLEEIKKEFTPAEARLVESIFNELKSLPGK